MDRGTPPDCRAEDGFTIVETIVATLLLVVGMFGMLTLLDRANATTRDSLSREQATTLARDVLERSRLVPYSTLGTAAVPTTAGTVSATQQIRTTMTGDTITPVSPTSFSLVRRGVTYTVTATACRVDDPVDGLGPIDERFCAWTGGTGSGTIGNGSSTGGPGSGPGCVAGKLQLLGVTFTPTACSLVVSTLCAALGSSGSSLLSSYLTRVTALIDQGADVQVCSGSLTLPLDPDPDDLTRVTTTVRWNDGRAASRSLSQSTLVPKP